MQHSYADLLAALSFECCFFCSAFLAAAALRALFARCFAISVVLDVRGFSPMCAFSFADLAAFSCAAFLSDAIALLRFFCAVESISFMRLSWFTSDAPGS